MLIKGTLAGRLDCRGFVQDTSAGSKDDKHVLFCTRFLDCFNKVHIYYIYSFKVVSFSRQQQNLY